MPLDLAPTPGADHLTEEQLTDLLLDQGTAVAQWHIDRCNPCRLELDHLRASITDFNNITLAWAEDHAPQRIPVPSHAALRWHRIPVWAAVAAIAIAAIFLVGAHERQLQSSASNLAAEASAQASIVADDNRLLMAIDQEIRLGQQTSADISALGLAQKSPSTAAANLEN